MRVARRCITAFGLMHPTSLLSLRIKLQIKNLSHTPQAWRIMLPSRLQEGSRTLFDDVIAMHSSVEHSALVPVRGLRAELSPCVCQAQALAKRGGCPGIVAEHPRPARRRRCPRQRDETIPLSEAGG